MTNTFIRRNWKLLINVITIGALVFLIVAIRHQLGQTFANLGKVHAWALLLMLPIEYLNYHAQTRLYQSLFKIVGDDLSYKSLFKISLELNFVNHVFPSGGVSGISYFGLRLKREGFRAAKTTVVQMMKLVLVFVSFELLLLIGMFILAVAGRSNNFVIFIGTSLSTLLVVGTLLFIYVVGSKQRINSTLLAMTRFINRIIHWLHLGRPETISTDRARTLFDELHENYLVFRSKLPQLKQPFWYALLANITEVLAVYVVFVAFGRWVNVGAVILAYAVANFAGLVSVMPGGVGVYEALMTAVMVTVGVPAALTLPVIIMYRVVNTIIQVPPGFVLYHRHLQQSSAAPKNGP